MSHAARVLFDDKISTCYSTMTITSPECDYPLLDHAFTGQMNGMAGGARDGLLFLLVGNRIGAQHIRVELHESAPPVDMAWDDIVEVSCYFDDTPIYLLGWAGDGGGGELVMDDGTYRARLCVNEYCSDRRDHGQNYVGEKYLLLFWPEPQRRADAVIKQTYGTDRHAQQHASNASAAVG